MHGSLYKIVLFGLILMSISMVSEAIYKYTSQCDSDCDLNVSSCCNKYGSTYGGCCLFGMAYCESDSIF
uniref:Uncharacterized protein n=1 Tax=Acrobeloides nanus TaxID=290746 RepID=A0A914DMX3_9BILA